MASNLPSPSAVLAVRELCFSRNDEPIFGPLSFELRDGHAMLIEGDNGAGKTTLLRVLAGFLTPTSGDVLLDGAAANWHARSQRMSYLGHTSGLKSDLTGLQNLRALLGMQGQRPDRSLQQAIDRVGLPGFDDVPLRALSAGQKKRMALAKLWLSPAKLWMLDEPYANLDLDGIALVNNMIEEHVASGGSVMLTSHGAYASPPVRTQTLRMQSAVTA